MANQRPFTSSAVRQVQVHSTFFSWGSVFAGMFISFITFFCLMALGMGIGGIALSDLEGARSVGWGAIIWTLASAMISLFTASFAASRVSNYISSGVGMVQGATIAALFFGLLFWMAGSFTGAVGGAVGTMARAVPIPSMNLSDLGNQVFQNAEVRAYIRQEMNELGIQPEQVDEVAVGVGSRLLTGDVEGARQYLAVRTNIDPSELSSRVDAIQARISGAAASVVENMAQAFSGAGWFLFGLLLLGLASSISGGVVGSKSNAKHSLEELEVVRAA